MAVNSSIIRLIWSVIEETPTRELASLTDTALIKLLIQQASRKILLSGEDVCDLYEYLGARIMLIRDMAESRSVGIPFCVSIYSLP